MLLAAVCNAAAQHYAGLQSTLWVQSAAEYSASTLQAFNAARSHLPAALIDQNWTAAVEQKGAIGYQALQPAVIFDVDETVLSNSLFQGHLVKTGKAFNWGDWQRWVMAARATPIAGAEALIKELRQRGVAIFYVTNRAHHLKEATVSNLKKVDADVAESHVLCRDERAGWGRDKGSRRAAIAQSHRIIMIIGDNYNDFRSLDDGSSPRERVDDALDYESHWGERWFIVSNPQYGHWEGAIYGTRKQLSAEQKLQRKYDYLKTPSDVADRQ